MKFGQSKLLKKSYYLVDCMLLTQELVDIKVVFLSAAKFSS